MKIEFMHPDLQDYFVLKSDEEYLLAIVTPDCPIRAFDINTVEIAVRKINSRAISIPV